MTTDLRPEYPRPHLQRRGTWFNLNGTWQFEIDAGESGAARGLWDTPLQDRILVPFAPESKLSGVGNVDFMPAVWYRRTFFLPPFAAQRVLLHFGAVDESCEVRLNGHAVGSHQGGYTPFVLDITAAAQPGENTLVVAVRDHTRDTLVPSGKQSERYENYGCMYTRSTGIWQTVWVELVPQDYIVNTQLTPDVDNRTLHANITVCATATRPITATVSLQGQPLFQTQALCGPRGVQLSLQFPAEVDMQLWAPQHPTLYDLTLQYGDDEVTAYFGMRKVSLQNGALCLNDKPIFMRLVLDQGYFPDGIYTAPSDEALKEDILRSMAAGFNGARMHMKVFEPRYLYWADRLGYLLWGEYANWGLDDSNPAALLSVLREVQSEVARDYNSPAIIGWCPFNETSQARHAEVLRSVYHFLHAMDPMRPVIDTSGYVHVETDIFDVHDYEQDVDVFRKRYGADLAAGKVWVNFPALEQYQGQPYFVSEFGGARWDTGRDALASWGYGNDPRDLEEFYARFSALCGALLDSPAVCGYCYTQLTDVFQEKNGIYAFDRSEKFDLARLRAVQMRPAAIEQ